MDPQKSVTFELQRRPISDKTCRRSWNLIMTLEDTSTNSTHILKGRRFHSILKQNYSICYIKAFIHEYFIVFLAISSRFELRVYGLWLTSSMRLDCRKDIKPLKLIRLIYIWSLKPASYSLPTEIIRDVK